MITRSEETLSRPKSAAVPLRSHPSIRGRWPAHPFSDRASAANPPGDGDTLELATLHAPRVIIMRSHYDGVTYYRTLFLTSKPFAKRLAAFLKSRVGETIAEIGRALIDF